MIITITGKSGVGKTTLAKHFSTDYTIIDADKIGHNVLKIVSIKNMIKEKFGNSVIQKNEISRPLLREKVMDKKNLKTLNALVHPEMIKIIKIRLKEKTIIDAALVTELNLDKLSDAIILIKRNIETNMTNLQKDYERASFIINNNSSKENLIKKGELIIRKCEKHFIPEASTQ